MITRFITEVSTVFNPFSPKAKTARLFLSFLPPNARSSMKIDTRLLPRASKETSVVRLKFSEWFLGWETVVNRGEEKTRCWLEIEDGKEMNLDAEKLGIKGVMEEVDRHSRVLSRQESLTGNWGGWCLSKWRNGTSRRSRRWKSMTRWRIGCLRHLWGGRWEHSIGEMHATGLLFGCIQGHSIWARWSVRFQCKIHTV